MLFQNCHEWITQEMMNNPHLKTLIINFRATLDTYVQVQEQVRKDSSQKDDIFSNRLQASRY